MRTLEGAGGSYVERRWALRVYKAKEEKSKESTFEDLNACYTWKTYDCSAFYILFCIVFLCGIMPTFSSRNITETYTWAYVTRFSLLWARRRRVFAHGRRSFGLRADQQLPAGCSYINYTICLNTFPLNERPAKGAGGTPAVATYVARVVIFYFFARFFATDDNAPTLPTSSAVLIRITRIFRR